MRADARHSALIFSSLGDETRLQILSRLGQKGPQSTRALTRSTHLTRQGVTKHLLHLQRAGLLHMEARGRERIWTIEQRPIDAAQKYLNAICAEWDRALVRLKALIEG